MMLLALLLLTATPDAGATEKSTRVVVFKKGTSKTDAEGALKKLGFAFHEGADSSRGKAYFYENGPQYLVDVPAKEQAAYEAAAKKVKQVHETWVADWSTEKD